MMNNRYFILDFLRTVAMALVIAGHIGQETQMQLGAFFGIQNFYWVSIGGVAVTIFLIVSGAVLQLQYGKSQTTPASFLYKRISRIYPLYMMSLLLSVAIIIAKSLYLKGGLLFMGVDLSDVVCSVTGFCAFIGKWGGPFLTTAWFIGLIITLYLFFPIISKIMYRFPHKTIFLLFVISVAARFFMGKHVLPNRALDWFPLCRVFEFGLGVYGAVLFPVKLSIKGPDSLISEIVTQCGRYSFVIFLVHYPLLFIINFGINFGFSIIFSILMYMVCTIIISLLFTYTESGLKKKLDLNKKIHLINRAGNQILSH